MSDDFEVSGNMEYLHESTPRTDFSGAEAGNQFPSDVSSFSGGEAQSWGEGVANLGINCAVVGGILFLVLIIIYSLALCCNCFGGDRTNACCCKARPQTVQPDALSAAPAATDKTGLVTIGGRDIPEATLGKVNLILLAIFMILYFIMCMLVFSGIGAIGDGVNQVIDGFGGVTEVMNDVGDVVDLASASVDNLAGNMSALGAEVREGNLPPFTTTVSDQAWAAGNATAGTADLLTTVSGIVDAFGADINSQLDNAKGLVDTYAVQAGTGYAAGLSVFVILLAVTLLPFGFCTCCYKAATVPNCFLLVFVWIITGVLMVVGAGMSDFCLNPGPSASIISLVSSTVSDTQVVDTMTYYLQCEGDVVNGTAPGMYGDLLSFQTQALSASQQVEDVKDDVESLTSNPLFPAGPRQNIESRLEVVQQGVWDFGNITTRLVGIAGCESLGGRIYKPVITGICEGIVGEGFAFLWAVHVAAGVFLFLTLVSGVTMCNGNRHPGGSKARDAVMARREGATDHAPPAAAPLGAEQSSLNPGMEMAPTGGYPPLSGSVTANPPPPGPASGY